MLNVPKFIASGAVHLIGNLAPVREGKKDTEEERKTERKNKKSKKEREKEIISYVLYV